MGLGGWEEFIPILWHRHFLAQLHLPVCCAMRLRNSLSVAGTKGVLRGLPLRPLSALLTLGLTHWGRDKMAAIFQTTFSNAFSSMEMIEFRLKLHWMLFLRVQSTISQHWFRKWLGAVQATSHYLNQWFLVYWRIYASLGLSELRIHWSRERERCRYDKTKALAIIMIKIMQQKADCLPHKTL